MEIYLDAFGDAFFVSPTVPSPPSKPPPSSSTCPALFTLPMRRKAVSILTQPLLVPDDPQPETLATADGTSCVTLYSPPRRAPSVPLPSPLAQSPAGQYDMLVTVARAGSAKVLSPGGSKLADGGPARQTSFDISHPEHKRDQGLSSPGAAKQPTSHAHGHLHAHSCHHLQQHDHDQHAHAHMHGPDSRGASGGGACPHGTQWNHSLEWWRSFSSSRLNEMAQEEPDMKSPEMRKVPYNPAEALCNICHSGEQPVPSPAH